jgi:hypothetical protein
MLALAPWALRFRASALPRDSKPGVKEVEDTWPLVPRPAAAVELRMVVLEEAVSASDRRSISLAVEHLLLRNAACHSGGGDGAMVAEHIPCATCSCGQLPLDLHRLRTVAWLHDQRLIIGDDGTCCGPWLPWLWSWCWK